MRPERINSWRFWRAALAALLALLLQQAALARIEHGVAAAGAPSLSAAEHCSADPATSHRQAPGFPIHACAACVSCNVAAVGADAFHPVTRTLAVARLVIGLPDQRLNRTALPEAATYAPRAPPARA